MSFLEQAWHKNSSWLFLLRPVSKLFEVLAARRRRTQQNLNSEPPQVPLIVVGNISAGGTGKTPVVMALVKALAKNGFKPGVVSRGYGGKAKAYPLIVTADTPVAESGDEAKLIAEHLACPVVVDPDRPAAVRHALDNFDITVLVSDDGLQHYNMPRTIEIVVIDAQRLFGNGFVFPAGPLREPVSRLDEVDFLLLNGEKTQIDPKNILTNSIKKIVEQAHELTLEPSNFVNQVTGDRKPFAGAPFNMGTKLHAVAGIGNPERFFSMLESLPYPVDKNPFPDHHDYQKSDFDRFAQQSRHPVVMTEKDAIKCRDFAGKNFWTLMVELKLPDSLVDDILAKLASHNK